MPKSRDRFDPKHFLKKVFKGKAEDVVILDSNKLPDNWRDLISTINPNSNYKWDKKDDISRYDDVNETEDDNEEVEPEDTNNEEVVIEDIGPEPDMEE